MTNATYQGIATMIASLEIPYAYYQFPEGTEQATPFICFYFSDTTGFYADNVNFARQTTLVIELYTDEKRFDIESKVEKLLNDNELPYQRYESYIDSEQMLMQTYETEVFING